MWKFKMCTIPLRYELVCENPHKENGIYAANPTKLNCDKHHASKNHNLKKTKTSGSVIESLGHSTSGHIRWVGKSINNKEMDVLK